MRILLAGDRASAEELRQGLQQAGMSVDIEYDGQAALRAAQTRIFDAIVLSVHLPQIDGLTITQRLRASGSRTPILLLAARNSARDIVRGLDAGADDCLTRPFPMEVLLARIRARTREPKSPAQTKFNYRDLSVDVARHEAWRGKRFLRLTPTEFAILECLIRSPGEVIPRQSLIANVWGPGRDIGQNNLDSFMRLLRSKVDTSGRTHLIQTRRGVGYFLEETT